MTLSSPALRRRALGACFALALAGVLRAETPPPVSPDTVIYPRGTAASEHTGRVEKSDRSATAVAAAGLVLLAVGGWMWWRYRNGPSLLKSRTAQRLAIEETRALGNRQFLLVVTHEKRRFLLGVCPGRLEMLADLSPPSEGRPLS